MRNRDTVQAIERMIQALDEAYERDLRALEATRREDRAALERSLAIARRQISNDQPLKLTHPVQKNGNSVPINNISVRQAVREAITHMPDQFTLDHVRAYIGRVYPQIMQSTGARTIGARLSEVFAEEKIITQIHKGHGGKPSVYARVKPMQGKPHET